MCCLEKSYYSLKLRQFMIFNEVIPALVSLLVVNLRKLNKRHDNCNT